MGRDYNSSHPTSIDLYLCLKLYEKVDLLAFATPSTRLQAKSYFFIHIFLPNIYTIEVTINDKFMD